MTGTLEIEYVVQVKRDLLRRVEGGAFEETVAWVDVAGVTVPARTKRRTIIEKGLAEAGIEKTAELETRLLDASAAYVWRAKPPEPASLRLS